MKKDSKKNKEKTPKQEEVKSDEPKVKSSIIKKFGLRENAKILLG